MRLKFHIINIIPFIGNHRYENQAARKLKSLESGWLGNKLILY
jgi:hypothetical protein